MMKINQPGEKRAIVPGLLFLMFVPVLMAQQQRVEDTRWIRSEENSNGQRKNIFLQYALDHGRKEVWLGIFSQIVRMESRKEIEQKYIKESLDIIYSNRDCNDFTANGMLRLLYMDKEKKALDDNIKKQIKASLTDFKYWWDDERRDTTYRCYHTENHQGLYHTAELLAGQLYKDEVFTDGMTGREHMAHAVERLERWLEFRFRFGFSEWLSSYYDIDILLLTNLYDYAEDPLIRTRAGMVLDILMLDMALNNFYGRLGSTHGRIYARMLIQEKDPTLPVMKLAFGVGRYMPDEYIGAACLATSRYECPEAIQQIATDYSRTIRNRQRVSLDVNEAALFGLSYDNELDCHLFWSMQEFVHPRVITMSGIISEKYDTWPYRNYDHYIKRYEKQVEEYGEIVNPNLDRYALSEANIYTYRTPDYMLSCVQDYRPGAPGYQQHIWQASLDTAALVFTTHPGSEKLEHSPNYWAGNARMPRAVQHDNVVICIYDIPQNEKYGYTHAYFPRNAFDEVIEKDSWVFGRKGDGYIALYSEQETLWKGREDSLNDLVAPGRKNVWVCEMGERKQWGSFEGFVKAISSAEINSDGQQVCYASPSVGKMQFGWSSPFLVEGKEVSMRYDYRYDNPYCKALFDTPEIRIKKGKHKGVLHYKKGKRFWK